MKDIKEPIKIRCRECGHILAHLIKPIESGEFSIMCNHRKIDGKKCKTVNVIKSTNTDK